MIQKLFSEMAEQMMNNEISEEDVLTKIETFEVNEATWNELITQISSYPEDNASFIYHLSIITNNVAQSKFEEEQVYTSLLWKGRNALVIADFEIAKTCFERCQTYYKENTLFHELYNLHKVYGDTYIAIDRIAKALEYYKEMEKLAKDDHVLLCQSLHKIGSAQKKLGKSKESIGNFEKIFDILSAEDMKEKLSQYEEIKEQISLLAIAEMLFQTYEESEKITEKLDDYEKVIAFFGGVEDKKGQALAYKSMAKAMVKEKYSEKAIECMEKAALLFHEAEEYQRESELLTEIGNLHKNEGEFLKAIEYFEKSRKALRNADDEIIVTKIEKSQTVEQVEEQVDPDWSPEIITEDEKEITSLKEQLKEAEGQNNPLKQSSLLHSLGNIYFGLGKLDEAMESWNNSLEFASEQEDIDLRLQNYYRLGLLSAKRGDFESAKSLFLSGINILEERKDYFAKFTQEFVSENLELFHETVKCCVSMKNIASAFHFLEQARRWFFLSRIDEVALAARANVPDELKEEFKTVLKKLQRSYANSIKNGKREEVVLKAILDNKMRLEELRTQIEVLDPEWARVFGRQYRFDPIEVQKYLVEGSVLIEFFVSESACYIFIQNNQKIDFVEIKGINSKILRELYTPTIEIDKFSYLWQDWCIECKLGGHETQEKLEEDIMRFQWQDLYDAHKARKSDLDKMLVQLSNKILPKLLNKIHEFDADRLIIVPTYEMQLFPLHLMPISEDGRIVFQDQYEIVYFPSASLFIECNQRPYKQNNKMFVASHIGKNFHFFEEEIRTLQYIWHGDIESYTNKDVTPENICSNVKDAEYLHLALYSNSSYPDYTNSLIQLSGDKDNSFFKLRISDILEKLKLATEVVTLSANERDFKLSKTYGESMGLQQALLYAGSKNIIHTLWPVPDIASFLLMEKFYHGLAQGLRPAMALQEAQVELRQITVEEIKNRLTQQYKLLPESQGVWLKNICKIMDGKVRELTKEEYREAMSTLYSFRESVYAGVGDLEELKLQDFLFAKGKVDFTDIFTKKDSKPFEHPFYWGSFVCSGLGLSNIIQNTVEDDDVASFVYIDELGFSPGDQNPEKDIEDVLSVLTDEGIKAFESAQDIAAEEEERIQREKEEQEQLIASQILKEKTVSKKNRVKGRCPSCGKKIRCIVSSDKGRAKCPHCGKKIKLAPKSSPFDDIKIPAVCPHCASNIHCFMPMAGKKAKCPKCHKKVRIPKRDILLAEIASDDSTTRILLLNGN